MTFKPRSVPKSDTLGAIVVIESASGHERKVAHDEVESGFPSITDVFLFETDSRGPYQPDAGIRPMDGS